MSAALYHSAMLPPEEFDTAEFERFACPGCTEEVDVPAESAGKLVRCPYCNTDFFASAQQAHLEIVDDTLPDISELDRESAFDKLRIRNYTTLRMSAIRSRSWWLIGLCLALLVMLDMVGNIGVYLWVWHRWGILPTLQAVASVFGAMFVKHAYRRAEEFRREIEKSAIPEPTTPPDFSTLDNGSERLKQLDHIR